MKEIILKTTKGDIKVMSAQTSGFFKYRFGKIIHNGIQFDLRIENNKFCGYRSIVGDEALQYLMENEIFPLKNDGTPDRYIAGFLFNAL